MATQDDQGPAETSAEGNRTESLEDLASQFEVQQSQPAQRAETESKSEPKFESTDDALRWLAKQHSETEAKLRTVTDRLTQREQDDYVQAQMKDLETAIKTIKDDVDIDDMFVEGALHVKYNRDANFQRIFDNRHQNPAAYKKALGIIAAELKAKESVKHDPQLAENTRALDQLQRSSRTGNSQESPDQVAAGLGNADFDRYWENLKMGG